MVDSEDEALRSRSGRSASRSASRSSSSSSSSSSASRGKKRKKEKKRHKDKKRHKAKHKKRRHGGSEDEDPGSRKSGKATRKEFDCTKCGGKFHANSGAGARPCTSSDGSSLCDGGSKEKFDAWKAAETAKAVGERRIFKKKPVAPKSAGQTARLLKRLINHKMSIITQLSAEVEELESCVAGLDQPSEVAASPVVAAASSAAATSAD